MIIKRAMRFFVEGKPKGQPRPRACVRGKHAGVYDDGSIDGWKQSIALEGRSHRPRKPISGPVEVHWVAYMPRPKRLCRRKDPDGPIPCLTKPDVDNIEKALLDALTDDGWFVDDKVVYATSNKKLYHGKGSRPGMAVVIKEVDDGF